MFHFEICYKIPSQPHNSGNYHSPYKLSALWLVYICIASTRTIMADFTEGCYSFIQVIAAVSYQIVPADTQYAEIPLAVVRSSHQRAVCALL